MPRSRNTTTAVPVVTTAETALVTLPAITLQAGNAVDLLSELDFTTGASTTAVTIRVRRGVDTTGTVVATIGPIAAAASTRINLPIVTSDVQNVDVAGQQYTVTVQQTAATGNGTGNTNVVRADY